jgi:hypothetical protein
MVGFEFQEQGILVGGRWHPIVKMDWVEGDPLNRFVAGQLEKRGTLRQLLRLWVRLAQRLYEADVAHADLQHGNILLVPPAKENEGPRLRLVDYDGMHVPALADQPSGELGHRAYQHPDRLRHGIYRAEVDRFSHLAIYTAIQCLTAGGRALWERFDTGDNLLFREQDFTQPEQSELFHELWACGDPAVHVAVGRLLLATRQPLDEVPLLHEMQRGKNLVELSREEELQAEDVLNGASVAAAEGAERVQDPFEKEVVELLGEFDRTSVSLNVDQRREGLSRETYADEGHGQWGAVDGASSENADKTALPSGAKPPSETDRSNIGTEILLVLPGIAVFAVATFLALGIAGLMAKPVLDYNTSDYYAGDVAWILGYARSLNATARTTCFLGNLVLVGSGVLSLLGVWSCVPTFRLAYGRQLVILQYDWPPIRPGSVLAARAWLQVVWRLLQSLGGRDLYGWGIHVGIGVLLFAHRLTTIVGGFN